jgi:DNA mismatch endonuclease, patch repair protein
VRSGWMLTRRRFPSFRDLLPASPHASAAARGASKKSNTRCEVILRRELWRRGIRYRLHVPGLPGHPDIVFPRQRVLVFCDGDFWHGRNLEQRIAKLKRGHNSAYWVAKIRRNVERDQQQTSQLQTSGWVVMRVWENDVLLRTADVADQIAAVLAQHHSAGSSPSALASSARKA